MDWFSIPIRVVTWPPQKFNRWSKKRGADHNALVREGSEILTPVIELAKQVGPTGIMWGSDEEMRQRLRVWNEQFFEQRRATLLTYANGHPSDDVREPANELVDAIGRSFSATSYLPRCSSELDRLSKLLARLSGFDGRTADAAKV